MEKGWIKLHRNIMDNWVYEDAEYLKIWITFLLEATHKPYKKLIGNNIEFLERGQFVFGRKKYSQRLNIKEWKIQKATELFVQDEMLKVIKRTNKYTIYEVVNYSLYQQQNQQEETSEITGLEQSKQQQHRQQNNSKTSTEQQQSNTLQEYKNIRNIYIAVIDYLNNKANKNFRPTTKKTQSLINARIKEGFSLDDFKRVIDIKCSQWLGTEMEKYLRPETLFGTKFESYLNEKPKVDKPPTPDNWRRSDRRL
jgi:uncharacterized phage protein (TIGR02220 family)